MISYNENIVVDGNYKTDGRSGYNLIVDRNLQLLSMDELYEENWPGILARPLFMDDDRVILHPWDSEKYERAVQYHLRKLERSKTGGIVMAKLKKVVTIVPFTELENNATATRDGKFVYFTPGLHLPSQSRVSLSQVSQQEYDYGDTALFTLCHELVHTACAHIGFPEEVWKGNPNDSLWEFVAMLITNICRSELNVAYVRLYHNAGFYKKMSEEKYLTDRYIKDGMMKFLKHAPDLFYKLGEVNSKWNAIRYFLNSLFS